MLQQLTIKNFGLIDNLSIDFENHLNVLTGETGAGKSIIIDALRYALGERLKNSQIRNTGNPCIVEAVFEPDSSFIKKYKLLQDFLTPEENLLIINRTFTPDGRNKNKINGLTVTVSQLKDIGNSLIDFHGPHDHQMLLSENNHILILDSLCSMDVLKDNYSGKYNDYLSIQRDIAKLNGLKESRERELDFITHQTKELEQVPLDLEQYNYFTAEQSKISNIESLCANITNLIGIFENENNGITDLLHQAHPHINNLTSIDKSTLPLDNLLNQIIENSNDFLYEAKNYLDTLSYDSQQAEQIHNTCNIYNDLLRKYGPSIESVIDFYKNIKSKYDLLVNLEHNDLETKKKSDLLQKELKKVASKITEKRSEVAQDLQKIIKKELSELGMPHIRFQCHIEKTNLNHSGSDKVIFKISTNPGEQLKPLSEIVSSGEAARVMLAFKKALIKVDPIPVLIFDEIDAQIGGRLGKVTGKKLKDISANRQVLLITHLPQIASFADIHYKVSKAFKNNKTTVIIDKLKDTDRIKELAKMMSGDKESKISVEHAEEMFSKAK